MKAGILILSFVLFLEVALQIPDSNYGLKSREKSNSISVVQYNAGYTFERVFKDGIWWIYVYDGEILVDIYEE